MRKPKLELKAGVFSLFQTIAMLNAEYQQGNLPDQFYIRKMNTYIQELSQLKRQLQRAAIDYETLLERLDLDQDYTQILKAIHEFQLIQHQQKQYNQNHNLEYQPLDLANQIQTITSHFITLSDYLYLVEVFETDFLFDLIRQLLVALHKLEFFADIFNQLVNWERQIKEKMTHNQLPVHLIPEIREAYTKIFENFRQKLTVV